MFESDPGQICVVGRCNFNSGIGYQTYAFSELFSRYFPTCIQPTEPDLRATDFITMPNGRQVPTWRGSAPRVSLFVDVFWNGVHDQNFLLVPQQGLRLASLVWDSDILPYEWVELLNNRFDAAVALSPHLIETARRSGVKIPCIALPLPLDIDGLLARPYRAPGKRLRIGSVAAFHPRKNTRLLVEAFVDAFRDRDDVELLIHSNLSFPGVVDHVKKFLAEEGVTNVILSHENLSAEDKEDLIDSFDIFVNMSRGEGYSIGPREALALGKVLVLSNTGGHLDLKGTPGVISVEPELSLPARFPEIDNRVIGQQFSVTKRGAAEGLKQAVSYLRSDAARYDLYARRQRAADFSFSRLSSAAGAILDPNLSAFRKPAETQDIILTEPYKAKAKERVVGAGGYSGARRRIIPAHDGGFFSIFNAFFSNLVWDLRDERCHSTLPDWDVGRLLMRYQGQPIQSFCYGQPQDGNVWTKLYEPLFGLTEMQMQSADYLYRDALPPQHLHNEVREPLLTYVHAARLYGEPWFRELRRQYSRVYKEHIRLKLSIQEDIDRFHAANMAGHVILGAHVRHPSHTVEQPGAIIAHADEYIARLDDLASRRGLSSMSDTWRVFLATDQDRVVARFHEHFGDRLVYWQDARRTTEAEDSVFDDLPDTAKNADGFQLQHLVAADRANWSTTMAVEVIRDAHLMAQCNALFHVVSNVSTAVSYINPDCEMLYCV